MVDLEKLKIDYNYNLNRLYNGCNYVDAHPEECDKYVGEIEKIYNNVTSLIDEIEKYTTVTRDEILGGFKL